MPRDQGPQRERGLRGGEELLPMQRDQGLQRDERLSRGRELLRAVLERCQGLKRDYL